MFQDVFPFSNHYLRQSLALKRDSSDNNKNADNITIASMIGRVFKGGMDTTSFDDVFHKSCRQTLPRMSKC